MQANSFYKHLAIYIAENGKIEGFLSENFIFCTNNPSEFVFVWALLDLPLKSADVKIKAGEGRS